LDGEVIVKGDAVGEPWDVDGLDGTLLCKISSGTASSGAGFNSLILAGGDVGPDPPNMASTVPDVNSKPIELK
jgi:hypothetical protein